MLLAAVLHLKALMLLAAVLDSPDVIGCCSIFLLSQHMRDSTVADIVRSFVSGGDTRSCGAD